MPMKSPSHFPDPFHWRRIRIASARFPAESFRIRDFQGLGPNLPISATRLRFFCWNPRFSCSEISSGTCSWRSGVFFFFFQLKSGILSVARFLQRKGYFFRLEGGDLELFPGWGAEVWNRLRLSCCFDRFLGRILWNWSGRSRVFFFFFSFSAGAFFVLVFGE